MNKNQQRSNSLNVSTLTQLPVAEKRFSMVKKTSTSVGTTSITSNLKGSQERTANQVSPSVQVNKQRQLNNCRKIGTTMSNLKSISFSVAPSSATVFRLSNAQRAVAEQLLQKPAVVGAIESYASELLNQWHYNTPGSSKTDTCFEDLVQAGYAGVCKAVETYNPNHIGTNGKKASLQSFAIETAQHAIFEEYNRCVWGQTVAEARSKRDVLATVSALAKGRGIPEADVPDVDVAKVLGCKVETVRKYRQTVVTLNLGNDDRDDEDDCNVRDRSETRSMYDNTIVGRNRELAVIVARDIPFVKCALRDALDTAFEILNKRETIAVVYSRGLFGMPVLSQREIARKLHVSPAAVSTMISVALDKMHFTLVAHSKIEYMNSPVFGKYRKGWKRHVNKKDLKLEDEISMLFA